MAGAGEVRAGFYLMKNVLGRVVLVLAGMFLAVDVSWGRMSRLYSYEELFQMADVVAIVESLSNVDAADKYTSHPHGRDLADFQAIDTKFKVLLGLKGELKSADEITVLHYMYSDRVRVVHNGARFIKFPTEPFEYQVKFLQGGVEKGSFVGGQSECRWLAFLKKRPDGRYEPVTDQYDSADSFRVISEASGLFGGR